MQHESAAMFNYVDECSSRFFGSAARRKKSSLFFRNAK